MLFILVVIWKKDGFKMGVASKLFATSQTFKDIQESATICCRAIVLTFQTSSSAGLSFVNGTLRLVFANALSVIRQQYY